MRKRFLLLAAGMLALSIQPAVRAGGTTQPTILCDEHGLSNLEVMVTNEDRTRIAPNPEVDAQLRSRLAAKESECYAAKRERIENTDSPLINLSGAAVSEALAGDSWRISGKRLKACEAYKASIVYYAAILNDRDLYGEPIVLFNARRRGANIGRKKVLQASIGYCR